MTKVLIHLHGNQKENPHRQDVKTDLQTTEAAQSTRAHQELLRQWVRQRSLLETLIRVPGHERWPDTIHTGHHRQDNGANRRVTSCLIQFQQRAQDKIETMTVNAKPTPTATGTPKTVTPMREDNHPTVNVDHQVATIQTRDKGTVDKKDKAVTTTVETTIAAKMIVPRDDTDNLRIPLITGIYVNTCRTASKSSSPTVHRLAKRLGKGGTVNTMTTEKLPYAVMDAVN